ncbi:MAG TPA: crosslink repair DNA glycosylase YcaQ family protein, partial [Microlunatus sp.]|nr:crosslink repair DNA glycosylase YcaQ family protein [Microlunatus sp.]
MRRWTEEDLRLSTLRRQFPWPLDGSTAPTPAAVLDLVAAIAPIQSQVPRAPFVTLATRLPGVRYADLVDLFEDHRLVKASTLRGTVFTSDRRQYAWAEAIARSGRAQHLAGLVKVPVDEVDRLLTAVEHRAADWVAWDDLIEHTRTLMQESRPEVAAREHEVRVLLWGLAGLLRRPPDSAWHKRTDVLRRSSRAALPELVDAPVEEAVTNLVERHLGAYGPVSKDDLCFFLGVRRTPVNRALAAIADRVITGEGPDGRPLVDLDDAVAARDDEPEAARGVRLLAEFDGCLMGYAGSGRLRYLT